MSLLSAERKTRIEKLTSWGRQQFIGSQIEALATSFWHSEDLYRATAGGIWTIRAYSGSLFDWHYTDYIIDPIIRKLTLEAQKRWMVSETTARDYARIAYETIKDEIYKSVLRVREKKRNE